MPELGKQRMGSSAYSRVVHRTRHDVRERAGGIVMKRQSGEGIVLVAQ